MINLLSLSVHVFIFESSSKNLAFCVVSVGLGNLFFASNFFVQKGFLTFWSSRTNFLAFSTAFNDWPVFSWLPCVRYEEARIQTLVFFSPQDILDLPAFSKFCTFLDTGRTFFLMGDNLLAQFCELFVKIAYRCVFFLFDQKD